MAAEVPGQRPAVLSIPSRTALDEYRAFRHIVRNVYTFNLNAAKIGHLISTAPSVFECVRAELSCFATFLEKRADAGEDGPPSEGRQLTSDDFRV
jgi:hypothetical protein